MDGAVMSEQVFTPMQSISAISAMRWAGSRPV